MRFRFTSYGSIVERAFVGVTVVYLSIAAHVVALVLAILVLPLFASLLTLLRPTVVNEAPPPAPVVEVALIQLPEPEPEPVPVEPASPELQEPEPTARNAGSRTHDARAKREALATARTAGILGMLSSTPSGGAFASLTGTATFSSGLSDDSVYGGLLGNEIGEASGFGGLGLGSGGGGTGEGTIGLGTLGTIGRGSGYGYGYGSGSGRLSGPRRSSVRLGRVRVTAGGLDEAVARRAMRRSLPRLRACAQRASATQLSVVLDVAPGGAVRDAALTGSVDDDTRGCLRRELQQLVLPQAAAGITLRVALTIEAG